jgi:eukaryotic-like serine/threonine-protein kinase
MNLTAQTALQDSKYILDTQLGKGVFSLTYRATNTHSGQTVAIKTLGDNMCQHPDFDQFKQKFLELAERLSHCQHPNLVQVRDRFEEAGRPYLVLDYIPGPTLAELVKSKVLPQGKAIKYICQISNALRVLHQAGLLHQDVKPQNIIWRQDKDDVVLCEFGITSWLTPGAMQTHASLLSAGYAPLEQYVFEAERTKATDVYALAATLYHLVTGRPPLPPLVRQALRTNSRDRLFLPNSEQESPKLNPVVKQAICRGLAIEAEKRPPTVEAWLSLLKVPKKTKPKAKGSQPSVAKPQVQDSGQAHLKSAIAQRRTPAPQIPETISTPRPTPVQLSAAQFNAQDSGQATANSAQFAHQAPLLSTIHNNGAYQPTTPRRLLKNLNPQVSIPTPLKTAKSLLPLRALIMTGAIAASLGIGFGFAIRLNGPNVPGSTFLHTKQSFPPSHKWPRSEPQL